MLRVTGYGQTGPYSGPARLRPRRPRRRRPRLSRRHAEGHAGHARVDHARRLHDRPLRLPRRADGAAPPRSSPAQASTSTPPSTSRCSAAPTNWRRPTPCTAPCASDTGSTHNDFACPHGHFADQGRQVGGDLLRHRQAVRAGWRRRWAARSWRLQHVYGEQKTRLEHRHDVNEIVRDWCGSLTREQVLERCYATDAPAGPLNNIADIFGDRQFHARRNLVAIDDPDTGESIIVPSPVPRCRRHRAASAASVRSSASIRTKCSVGSARHERGGDRRPAQKRVI